jgi:hypothetical protein
MCVVNYLRFKLFELQPCHKHQRGGCSVGVENLPDVHFKIRLAAIVAAPGISIFLIVDQHVALENLPELMMVMQHIMEVSESLEFELEVILEIPHEIA